ncbi:MAG: tagatose 1,6-diphosphate aldolase [Isosphaeraceae bacterium]
MASPENGERLGATVLLGKGLTPGKLRGLQRISNPAGTLTMLALDQNSSVIEMACKALRARGEDREPTYEEIVDAKLDLMRNLAPAASGVLIDAYYGAWSAIASEAIPPDTGLLVRYEMSGSPKNKVRARWRPSSRAGASPRSSGWAPDALKLLAQFEPTEPDSAEHSFRLIETVYEECKRHDLLLLLETVSFPFGGEKKTDASYLDRKPRTVIESARQLSRFCDIYKAEFPGTAGREPAAQHEDNLHALDAASERPWVLLSAGVDFRDYLAQVEQAMGVGASGILGGRAIWKEYFLQEGAGARSRFAATTARERLAELDALVRERGTPWFARYGFSREELRSIRAAEGWHARYASRGQDAPARSGPGRHRRRSLLIRR